MNTGSQEWEGPMLQMARDGVLQGVVVLNNLHLGNAFCAAGVPWVVVREYDLEDLPALRGNEGDLETGRGWWQERRARYINNGLDRRCYIQILNEKNSDRDAYFQRGVTEAANQDDFKIGLFGDSHGNPAGDTFPVVWKHRVDSRCMEVAKAGGNIYIYHSYGPLRNAKETDEPGCGVYFNEHNEVVRWDDVSWQYYGGRYRMAYEQFVPVDQRIPVVLGEAGPSDAIYRGPQQILHEYLGYQLRLANDPYAKAVCMWAVGWQEPWYGSNFGPGLAEIYQRLKAAMGV